jgi:hypothetical protein
MDEDFYGSILLETLRLTISSALWPDFPPKRCLGEIFRERQTLICSEFIKQKMRDEVMQSEEKA